MQQRRDYIIQFLQRSVINAYEITRWLRRGIYEKSLFHNNPLLSHLSDAATNSKLKLSTYDLISGVLNKSIESSPTWRKSRNRPHQITYAGNQMQPNFISNLYTLLASVRATHTCSSFMLVVNSITFAKIFRLAEIESSNINIYYLSQIHLSRWSTSRVPLHINIRKWFGFEPPRYR